MIDALHYGLGGVSGILVGFVLGLGDGGVHDITASAEDSTLLFFLGGGKTPQIRKANGFASSEQST